MQQYFAVERTKAAIPKETHFKVLSSKTLVPAIMDHLSKHDYLSINNWTELKTSMNSHGYLFYDISESKVRLCVQELKAHFKLCDLPKTEDLEDIQIYNPDYYTIDMPAEIKHKKWEHETELDTIKKQYYPEPQVIVTKP